MITAAVAMLASGFSYMVDKDPFTDEQTFVAAIGNRDKGPSLAVECGSSTDRSLVVHIVPGFRLYFSGVPGTYTDRYRFDDQEPGTVRVLYRGRDAWIVDGEASRFISGLRTAQSAILEMTDASSVSQTITISTVGAADAIARVEASCRAK